jgi:hypothetical protein
MKKLELMLNWSICSFSTVVKLILFKDSQKEDKLQAEMTTILNPLKEKEKHTKKKLFQLFKNSKKMLDLSCKSMLINLRKKSIVKLRPN